MPLCLLVEDEEAIAQTLVYALETEGFSTIWLRLGQDLLKTLKKQGADFVILDIGLPDRNGFDLCREIRIFSDVPILFLTARQGEIDKILGLELGGDDYVTKPFSPREVVARVKRILKRSEGKKNAKTHTFAEVVAKGERADIPSLSIYELKKLGSSLQFMRERLEGKRYVEEYVWSLTHEMKSPLTAIQASSELLQESMPKEQQEKFLRAIREQARRLHDLIEKMLEQASLEYRQGLQDSTSINMYESARTVTENLAAKTAKLDLKIVIEGQGTIIGEKFLVEQALNNLLENACNFSPCQTTIQIKIVDASSSLTVLVTDQGTGIPEYARGKIFDRFYSLPRPREGSKSTGLGLSFVRQVMLLHGGTVDLTHPEFRGTQARLIFPKKT